MHVVCTSKSISQFMFGYLSILLVYFEISSIIIALNHVIMYQFGGVITVGVVTLLLSLFILTSHVGLGIDFWQCQASRSIYTMVT